MNSDTRNRILAYSIAAAVLVAPLPAGARGFGGGGFGGFHGGYSGRASSGGFNLGDASHSDFGSSTVAHRPPTNNGYDRSGNNGYDHNGNNGYDHNGGNNGNFSHNNVNNVNVNRNVVVNNPQGYSAWGWHGGVAWAPVGGYWGGGFWGGFAAGAIVAGTTAAVIAASTPQYPVQYVVAQNSPGSRLLSDYGLTQTACGPDVVYINYSGSAICAAPNAKVAAGNYTVNVSTLTLQST